jgi:hypothetical protein
MTSFSPVEGLTAAAALDPRRWWALALLCGAFFMVILDAAIVIVALPRSEPTSASPSRACSGC